MTGKPGWLDPSAPPGARAPIFPSLLGAGFDGLDSRVAAVHGGGGRRLRGRVSVRRGPSWAARMLAAAASLPPTLRDVPLEVQIESDADGERWTRIFDHAHRMRTALRTRGATLVESLGPVSLRFHLSVENGGMRWTLVHVTAAGLPLPLRWFDVTALIDAAGDRYHFAVGAALRGVGAVVHYEGTLDAAG